MTKINTLHNLIIKMHNKNFDRELIENLEENKKCLMLNQNSVYKKLETLFKGL